MSKVELNTIKDRLEAAKFYHRSGELAKAEEEYRKILKEEPNNPEATHLLGLLAMQMGKFEIAEQLFKLAIELDRERPEYLVNLGVLYYLKKDYTTAKDLFLKAIEMDNRYLEAHANLGKILAEENDLPRAREHLVRAVNMGDNDPSTLITLAEVNFRLKLYDRAEDVCKLIFDQGIDEPQVYDILIESLLKQNRAQEAVPFLEIMINRDRSNQKYQELLKEVYKQTGFSDN